MNKYQKILVCLDQTELDLNLIKVAGRICELTPLEVTFVNVIRDFNLPDDVKKEFPQFMEKAIDERRNEIRSVVKEYFNWPNVDVKIEILQGHPAKSILKLATQNHIDLIISGRKKDGLGVVRSRLARKSDCSFLMVAEGLKMDLKRILIPIDFSNHSKMAILKAIEMAETVDNNVEIYAQNVYSVPTGYHYTGKSHQEFSEIMKENAMKTFEAFIRTVNTSGKEIHPIYSLDEEDNFVSCVRNEAKRLRANLIIIGAKGQTSASALLIGSRAERLVMMQTNSSMLVVRKKGDKAGFKEFFKEL